VRKVFLSKCGFKEGVEGLGTSWSISISFRKFSYSVFVSRHSVYSATVALN